ncbi:squamosa promoter-binding-like protein 16 [Rhododendron vialii]|uniref:squamosa promoter-binding-like protein 16 n=1 Tax=Rhododendron vialii TaxID=182163 RepID=UPI00266030BC|nr:squamosa promoter-binding-like protein 16 [Rhododendron vialii]
MEWELKDSVWDFGELIGSSSSLGVHKNGGGFSVDLKLGGLGDLGFGSFEKLKETTGSTTSSSPSGSSKRSRVVSNGAQIMSCLVDGCNADLSKFRDYYRRHRVCERHSKTPLVTIGGKEQRFCQQCSRFQAIGEFDEKKRSCRKRLDGHNRRRRKPQPEAFHMSSGSFWSNHQGARLLCFSGPEAYQTSSAGSVLAWPRIAKHRQDLHAADQQSIISNSTPCLYNGGDKRSPFSLVNYPERRNQTIPEVSACHRLVNSSTSPEIGRGHQKILSDRLTQCINSKHAHSLLSSHPTQPLDVIHYSDQSIGIGLDNDGLVQYSHSQGVENPSLLVPQGSNETNPRNQIFQVAPDDLLEKRASQVLPFSWK